jgi:nicotinamidase-related amidase
MGRALLVIDMQKGSFTSETPRYDSEGVVKRINLLAEKFRATKNHVVFVQHDGSKEDTFIPGTAEWELLSSLEVFPEDITIQKTANDSFYNSILSEKLTELGVRELYITGCATDFCVESTIQSALVKNYNITVIKDGHTTANRPSLAAKQVIAHYNWVWQNMIPTKGQINLIDAEEIKINALKDYVNQ